MKFFLLSFLSLLALSISGCSSYKAMKHFNQEESYTKAVQNTKKSDLLVKNEINAILNATYLNSVSEKLDTKTQNFVIGLYTIKEPERKELKNDYLLSTNHKKVLRIKNMNKKYLMYKNIPIETRWPAYYLVDFDKNGSKEFQDDYLFTVNNNKVVRNRWATYFLVDFDKYDKRELKNNYLLTMNNKKAIRIKKMDKKNVMYRNIPLKNRWATYYIVEFEKNDKANNLNLILTYKNKERTSLSFLAN